MRDDPIRFEPGKLRSARAAELGIRFLFGSVTSLVAALIAKRWGPLVGGLFLAFPAILPATLTFVEEKESNRQARHDTRGAAVAVPGLTAFALVIRWLGPDHPAIALVAAVVLWAVVAVAGYLAWRAVRERLGLDDHEDRADGRRGGPGEDAGGGTAADEREGRRDDRDRTRAGDEEDAEAEGAGAARRRSA